jgi:hypothetical protein
VYAFSVDVPMPVEQYKAVMDALQASGGNAPPERLLHFCTPTAEGFRITEVWESHEAVDRYGDEVIRPAIARVVGEEAVAGGPPPNQEFELAGLQVRAERLLP